MSVVMVTGISGCGSHAFCARIEEKDKKVRLYHSGDIIEELAQKEYGIPPENLLNLDQQKLADIRDRAFRRIAEGVKSSEKAVVDTHAQFYWNNVFTNAYNWKYLSAINPDMFLTIINKPSAIKAAQMATEQGRSQNHTINDLLLWQNIEVNVTRGWAENYQKPFYVLPSPQNPEIVSSLLQNRFLIYFSMPMTNADETAKRKISEFKERMVQTGNEIGFPTPIIDPRDIDLESDKGLSKRAVAINEDQTVHRDLDWYIAEATHVIAYYPEGSSISLGVSHEVIRAHESGKHVYIVCSMKKQSPFMRKSHKVFRDEEQFFRFFRKHMPQKLMDYRREK